MKMKAVMRKLERRIKAWEGLKSCGLDTKARSRLDAGGYKCPGSRKRK